MSRVATACFVILILAFTVSCQGKTANEQLELMNAQAGIEEQNKAIVMRWFHEVNKENFDQLFEELFAADCQQRMPPNAEPRNTEEFKALVDEFYTAFPEVTHAVGDIVAEGDKVAVMLDNPLFFDRDGARLAVDTR